MNKSDPTYDFFNFWIRWILLALVLVYFFFFRNRKQNKLDLKTRIWRRFLFTNGELFNYLNEEEKKEMLQVYNTTVQNASLFQNNKNNDTKHHNKRDKQKKSKAAKKVTFELSANQQRSY